MAEELIEELKKPEKQGSDEGKLIQGNHRHVTFLTNLVSRNTKIVREFIRDRSKAD